VGGLYENPISRKLVSSSIPYYQDDITWCVAKAGLAPTWLNVFIIFNSEFSIRSKGGPVMVDFELIQNNELETRHKV
jgi:hypothetical protein